MFRGMHGGFDLLIRAQSDCAPRNFVGEILARLAEHPMQLSYANSTHRRSYSFRDMEVTALVSNYLRRISSGELCMKSYSNGPIPGDARDNSRLLISSPSLHSSL
jgi:hypothetical protein